MGVVSERLYNGIVKENATFVQVLGMCPTLAVTTSAINGIGMGLSATVVLIGSNVVISLLKKVIPDEISYTSIYNCYCDTCYSVTVFITSLSSRFK